MLDALARALQLDDAERAHLFHLAHAADGTSAGMRPRRRPSTRWTPRPALQWVLDGISRPAIIRNGRMDLLATNHLGRAMHASVYDSRARRHAQLRPLHLPRRRLPAVLSRTGTPPPTPASPSCAPKPGATPTTRRCTTSLASCPPAVTDFRRRWGSHDVRLHGAGVKHFHHTVVGNLELAYESVDMIADPGLP